VPRRYIVDGWIAAGSAALLAGEGGAGKSLLGQLLCSCVALGRPFLGYATEQSSAAYITCEDDENELHHRQTAINAALGVTMEDYGNTLALASLKGAMNNELGTFDQCGRLTLTDRFREISGLERTLVVLDNLAHLFPGNENVRHEVAAFCNLLDRMAMRTDGSVVLLAHTPKSGAEYSGSTGWDAHVRQRLYLSHDELDPDARELRRSKSNYARRGETVRFYWLDGAFVREDDIPVDQREAMAATAQASTENAAFLRCLDLSTEQQRAVSHNPGCNYAPKIFEGMPQAKGIKSKGFAAAMERLLSLGTIALDQPLWRGSNRLMKQGIKRTEVCTDPPHEPLH
jgi:RecA-family ATPase